MYVIIGLGCHFHALAKTVLSERLALESHLVNGLILVNQNETAYSENLPLESLLQITEEDLPQFDTACICHQENVIDSMLKIIEVYPYLNDAYAAAEILIKDEAKLKEDQRAKILEWLGLDTWNMQDIRKRIRRLKWQRITYAAGAFVVGVGAGVYMIFKIVKP